MKKFLSLLLVLLLCVVNCQVVYAHNPRIYYQNPGNMNFSAHSYLSSSNNTIYYRFDYANSDMDAFASWTGGTGDLIFSNRAEFEAFVDYEASIWEAEISQLNIQKTTRTTISGAVVGRVTAKPYSGNYFAKVIHTPTVDTDSNGHYTAWELSVNIKNGRNLPTGVIAHEFGHVIGLSDTQEYLNLMTGTANFMSSTPTTQEVEYAKIVTGIHQCSWSYVTYSQATPQADSRHISLCYDCGGYMAATPNSSSYLISVCTYNNGVCIYCGAREGTSINSNPNQELLIE